MSLRIEILNPEIEEQYEAFVRSHPCGMLYYSVKYKTLIERHLNLESNYFVAFENDQVVAVFPV